MTDERRKDPKVLIADAFRFFRRNLTFWLAAISLIGGIVYAAMQKGYVPLYRSSVTFMIRPAVSVTADNLASNYAVISQISKSFPYIIINDGMKEIIREKTGEEISMDDVTTESLADTNSFTVSVLNEDKHKSYDVLKTIIENYSAVGEKIIGDTYINIISEIETSDEPANANESKKNTLIAMIVVTAAFAAAALLRSFKKSTVSGKRDIMERFNMQCLAAIPKMSRKRAGVLISDRRAHYALREQIKKLRVKIEGWSRETGAKTFLVTSSLADEGKSTVSVNLAISLAEKKLRVAIIDFDFRNPSILGLLGCKKDTGGPGLFDLLSGKADVDEIAAIDEETGIEVITSGSLKNHSVRSVINMSGMTEAMEKLRERYDFIIMDTPPSGLLSDSADLSRLADCGIYVIRCDYAPLPVIKDGLEILSDSGLKIAGCVLNYAKEGTGGYYGYYGYYRKAAKPN